MAACRGVVVGGWLALLSTPLIALEVAVLPPAGLGPWSAEFRAAAEDADLVLTVLQPEQVVDEAVLTPDKYPVALLLDAEDYADTVAVEGDAAAALQGYVQRGGSLLVLSHGAALSRPLRWRGTTWETMPAPMRRINLLANLGLLDAGQTLYGGAPAGASLRVSVPAPLRGRLPESLALPQDGQAFRFLPTAQLDHVAVTPWPNWSDAAGRPYGAGSRWSRTCDNGGWAGRYGWSPLAGPKLAADLLAGLDGWRAETARLQAAEEADFAGEPVKAGDGAWLDDPRPVVALQFNKGVVYVELWPDEAPQTSARYAKLIGEQFYDGIFIHRVEPGFVMQAGDPVTKQLGGPVGPGVGSGGPGYTIPGEFSDKPHRRGALSMARTEDPDSGGSQFFIVLDTAAHLDGKYAIFGQVLGGGMDIVDRLRVGDRIVHGWVVKPATP